MDILILIGSKSDLEKARSCTAILDEFEVKYKLQIASAHRTPELVDANIKEAEEKGAEVIIAMAGMAAHLPGVVASKTLIPVIGVPLSAKKLEGVDALYSVVQMPPGYPVATVGVDATKNAALLAIQFLSNSKPKLKDKVAAYREQMKADVIKANEEL